VPHLLLEDSGWHPVGIHRLPPDHRKFGNIFLRQPI
jgi:hypothetical protein